MGYAERTQFLGLHADALLVLAEVLRLAGRPAEAVAALAEAAGLFERKGNAVSARFGGPGGLSLLPALRRQPEKS